MFDECDKFSASHSQPRASLGEVRLDIYEKDRSILDVRLTASRSNHLCSAGFTLAIPAVGTGALGFPCNVVASSYKCDNFSAGHSQSQTSVAEVRFVIHEKDQSNFDVRLTASLKQLYSFMHCLA